MNIKEMINNYILSTYGENYLILPNGKRIPNEKVKKLIKQRREAKKLKTR
jgi:hypothetical protein